MDEYWKGRVKEALDYNEELKEGFIPKTYQSKREVRAVVKLDKSKWSLEQWKYEQEDGSYKRMFYRGLIVVRVALN